MPEPGEEVPLLHHLCLSRHAVVPFVFKELPVMLADESLVIKPGLVVASALAAFALNVSVFLLIGKTSALTMNIAGVVKDWMLIFLSVLMFK